MSEIAVTSIDPYRRGAAPKAADGEGAFHFVDLLDVVNPLQHIPGVNLLYRELSGDTIKAPAAMAGGALFGGPLGFVGAFIAAAIEELTGETPMGHATEIVDATKRQKAALAYSRTTALANDEIQR